MSENDYILQERLKMLCLHGERQNAEMLKSSTRAFRKICHKFVQFVYVSAPYRVITMGDQNAEATPDSEDVFSWFFNSDDKTYNSQRCGGPAIGFEGTYNFLESVFEREGPFDGILGFSQGACLAALLCSLQQNGLTKHIKFNFAIFVAGFKSQCLPHRKYFVDKIPLHTLHIIGDNDTIIPSEMSQALSLCFHEPVVMRHPRGHSWVASEDEKDTYFSFFIQQAMIKQNDMILQEV